MIGDALLILNPTIMDVSPKPKAPPSKTNAPQTTDNTPVAPAQMSENSAECD